MIQNIESQKTWDAIAKSFDTTRTKPWKQCIDYINALPKNVTVADIGCGNGRHLIPIAKHCKKAIGIDISQNLLDIVKEKLKQNNIKNTILIKSDATQIPLRDHSVDHILYIAALHNIKGRKNRIQSLKEIKRILKNNGTALISVWSQEQEKFQKKLDESKKDKDLEVGDVTIYWRQHGHDIPRFYHLYSLEELKSDIEYSGLKLIEIKSEKIKSKQYPDNYFAIIKKL